MSDVAPETFYTSEGRLLVARYDVQNLLDTYIGADWQEKALGAVAQLGELVVRDAQHWTCREADPNARFGLITLNGDQFAQAVPGLWELYKGPFQKLMAQSLESTSEGLRSYDTPLDALECVTQIPPKEGEVFSRVMEAHVDQRRTAILVIKAPAKDDEGRLVIAHNNRAKTVSEIKADATYISHIAGTLVCFANGDIYPHCTEPLKTLGTQRTVISLNYPKLSETPEQAQEILKHNLKSKL